MLNTVNSTCAGRLFRPFRLRGIFIAVIRQKTFMTNQLGYHSDSTFDMAQIRLTFFPVALKLGTSTPIARVDYRGSTPTVR